MHCEITRITNLETNSGSSSSSNNNNNKRELLIMLTWYNREIDTDASAPSAWYLSLQVQYLE